MPDSSTNAVHGKSLRSSGTRQSESGFPKPRFGLPISLWPIPDKDLAGIMQGYPQGFYGNGACTHSEARHFVDALYLVGMKEEADMLLSDSA